MITIIDPRTGQVVDIHFLAKSKGDNSAHFSKVAEALAAPDRTSEILLDWS